MEQKEAMLKWGEEWRGQGASPRLMWGRVCDSGGDTDGFYEIKGVFSFEANF